MEVISAAAQPNNNEGDYDLLIIGSADLSVVPGVTFTNPAIATVGLTEEQAIGKGYKVKTSVLPLLNRETTGVIKLVSEQGREFWWSLLLD